MSKQLRQRIYNKVSTFSFLLQRLRLWSRAGLLIYITFLHQLVFWVFGLPDITTAQTIIVSVITVLATPITTFYIQSGKNLYDEYVSLTYNNLWIECIDHIGFIIDKLRIFPLLLLCYYGFLLYMALAWGMDLGEQLSVAQATFISVFAGSVSLIFGFFVTTGEVNMKLEEVYVKRNQIEPSRTSSTVNLDDSVKQFVDLSEELKKNQR